MTEEMNRMVDRLFTSKDMREYLKNRDLDTSVDDMETLIYKAPISLEEKAEMLNRVKADVYEGRKYKVNEEDDETLRDWKTGRQGHRVRNYENYCKNIQKALELRTETGVFTVESGQYSEAVICAHVELEALFASLGEAEQWMREEMQHMEYEAEDIPEWFEVRLWQKNENGNYVDLCCYIYHNGVCCYAVLDRGYADSQGIDTEIGWEIQVEVPFQVGDLLEVDARPYGPKYRTMVTGIGDNRDCCSLMVITPGPDGVWEAGALKHNQVPYFSYPFVSPLYSATRCEGEMEEIFVQLRAFLGGSEERGRELSEYVNGHELRAEELIAYMENAAGNVQNK